MLMPSIFSDNLFDDWFDSFREMDQDLSRRLYGKHAPHEMKTDVRDHEDHYEVDIDLPGFKKEDISLTLEKGVLNVSVHRDLSQDKKNDEGRVIRQERYSGSMQRSFYVGEGLTQEDVSAKFEDGVLHVQLPKKDVPTLPEKKTILIEG